MVNIILIFAGAVLALCFIAFGFVAGAMWYRQKHKERKEEPESWEQEKIDKQWSSLFSFDGREVQ